MGRSHRFRVCSKRQYALFRLGFPWASSRKDLTKPFTATRRIIMQKARRHTWHIAIVLRPLVGTWFQVHIPPLAGVLLTFHSRYWCAIGRRRVFSLTGWSPQIQSRFHVTGSTQVLLWCGNTFVYGAVTLCGRPFQIVLLACHNPMLESYNPARETPAVWATPLSLAATDGIDFSFSSSGYLDVSVHQVVTCLPMDSAGSSRVPRDHRLFVSSPRNFADFHALLLSTPRHPPCALRNLAIEIPNSACQTGLPTTRPPKWPDRSQTCFTLSP